MVELNEKALEEEMAFCPNCGWNSAMDGPGDGLAEKLKAGSIALRNDRPASSSIMEEAATALQSQAAELQYLRADAENPDKGMWTFWNDKARELSEQVERLKTLNAELLTQAKGHAQEARTANSTIYEIYKVLSGGKGEPGNWHGAEPARRYVEAAELQMQKLTAENERLREALRPFARIAAVEDYADTPPGNSIIVNVDLCRTARSALETQEGGK